jgi:hypothetical protein
MTPNADKGRRSAARRLAWEIHRRNGHPPNYDGPCWGPLDHEVEEAEQIMSVLYPPHVGRYETGP